MEQQKIMEWKSFHKLCRLGKKHIHKKGKTNQKTSTAVYEISTVVFLPVVEEM